MAPPRVGPTPPPAPALPSFPRPLSAPPAPMTPAPAPTVAAAPSVPPPPAAPPAALGQVDGSLIEWFVGVAGSPTGPLSTAEVEQQLRSGVIQPSTLGWRDGQGEWAPLASISDFAPLCVSVSVLTPSKLGPDARVIPAPNVSIPFSLIPSNKPKPAEGALDLGSSPVASFASGGATPGPLAIGGANQGTAESSAPPADLMRDPFAPPAAPAAPVPNLLGAPVAASASQAPPAGSLRESGDASAGALSVPAMGGTIPTPEPSAPPGPKRAGMHPMAYAFIAMAAAFGAVAAYVLLVKQAPVPTAHITPSAEPTVKANAAPPASTPSTSSTASVSAAAPTESGAASARPAPLGGPAAPMQPTAAGSAKTLLDAKTAAPSTPTGGGANIDTSSFGNTGVAGPSANGPSGGSAAGAGGQLSQGEISGVVASNQTIIKRKCWQAALDAHAKDGATSAKVTASITIGPGGNVTSVSASGGGAFPGLADCIASRVRSWKFPASGGTTSVSVPFVFAGQ